MTWHPRSARNCIHPLAAIITCVVGFAVANSYSLASAGDESAPSNEVQQINLGAKPDISAGPVLVTRPDNAYLTFLATQYDEQGNAIGDGLSVIQLEGCTSWDFRCGGDEELASHPVDIEALDLCETYEVANSDWADSSENERHFIFTFVGFNPGVTFRSPHFECVAKSATVHFVTTPSFDEVIQYIDYLEAEDPPTTDDEEPSPEEDPYDEEVDDYDAELDDYDYDSETYDPELYDDAYDPGTYDE